MTPEYVEQFNRDLKRKFPQAPYYCMQALKEMEQSIQEKELELKRSKFN